MELASGNRIGADNYRTDAVKADRFVFFLAIFGFGFLFGMALVEKPEAKVCPKVEGQTPVSTRDSADGQYCMYQQTSRAFKVTAVRL